MVYVTGDTHGDPNRLSKNNLKSLNEGDTLIVCGDFGFIWDRSKAEQKVLKELSKISNIMVDKQYYTTYSIIQENNIIK